MIVISLTNCPQALRGDLTRWLQEIDVGVYVGNVSARVRDGLWKRITENVKTGRVVLVYSTKNEQHMDFRVHNAEWEPIDFDGLKLMLHPNAKRAAAKAAGAGKQGYSGASRVQKVRKYGGTQRHDMPERLPCSYAVVDVETTGLSVRSDRIIEIGSVRVENGTVVRELQMLVKGDGSIPPQISELTGITNEMVSAEGVDAAEAIRRLLEHIGDLPIVSHNLRFDVGFLSECCLDNDFDAIRNRGIDTISVAKRLALNLDNFKLKTMAERFNIRVENTHRSLDDCRLTQKIFAKLIEIENGLL